MKRVLILGFGEIGKSIKRLYDGNSNYEVFTKDVEPFNIEDQITLTNSLDVLHVCIPYNEHFAQSALDVIKDFKPKITIIHSTVPPGTTRYIHSFYKLPIAHSYVTGKHPNLTESLKTFFKAVGGIDEASFKLAHEELSSIGISAIMYDNPETSELAKVSDTTNYFASILHMKEVHNLCKKYGANFDQAYSMANAIYNDGYLKMESPQFYRQNLKYTPGKIGGHCVVPNAIILKNVCNSKWAAHLLSAYEDILVEEDAI